MTIEQIEARLAEIAKLIEDINAPKKEQSNDEQ